MYVIYEPKQAAIEREIELSAQGVASGYWSGDERYAFMDGMLIMHPTEDKAAIMIYRDPGLITRIGDPEVKPIICDGFFSDEERGRAVEELGPDWS